MSKKTKIREDVLERVFRLSDLLYLIYQNDYLGRRLVLKGGAAIHFIYSNMPHLTVGLDFNFSSDEGREDMLDAREETDKILTKILLAEGYDMEKVQSSALLKYNLKYTSTSGNADEIKIEINFMGRVPVFKIVEKKIIIFEKPEFKVRTYLFEELFALKLRALFLRGIARDLFDVYVLFEQDFDEEMLKKCFIFYYCLSEDFRKISMEHINKISPNDIEKLTEIDAAEIIRKTKEFVLELGMVNKKEQKFIRLFYDEKKVVLDLLFEGEKYNSHLGSHPMLKWRLRNM